MLQKMDDTDPYVTFAEVSRCILEMRITKPQKVYMLEQAANELMTAGEKLHIVDVLLQLDELDHAAFGKLCSFLITYSGDRKPSAREVVDIPENENIENKKRKRETSENRVSPKRQRSAFINRPKVSELNVVNSYHNGKPCIRCNRLANIFNERLEKICMPHQHEYGSCPLYCSICVSSVCENMIAHLKHSCEACNSTYSNHPTHLCQKNIKR